MDSRRQSCSLKEVAPRLCKQAFLNKQVKHAYPRRYFCLLQWGWQWQNYCQCCILYWKLAPFPQFTTWQSSMLPRIVRHWFSFLFAVSGIIAICLNLIGHHHKTSLSVVLQSTICFWPGAIFLLERACSCETATFQLLLQAKKVLKRVAGILGTMLHCLSGTLLPLKR